MTDVLLISFSFLRSAQRGLLEAASMHVRTFVQCSGNSLYMYLEAGCLESSGQVRILWVQTREAYILHVSCECEA